MGLEEEEEEEEEPAPVQPAVEPVMEPEVEPAFRLPVVENAKDWYGVKNMVSGWGQGGRERGAEARDRRRREALAEKNKQRAALS